MTTLYKFLTSDLRSIRNDFQWEIGEWYEEDGIRIGEKGFHACETPYQALKQFAGEVLAEVSFRGYGMVEPENQCWSEMKIERAWRLGGKDAVELAVLLAESCLGNFEQKYPNDKRPRRAIETSKCWLSGEAKIEDVVKADSSARAAIAETEDWAAISAASCAWAANTVAWETPNAEGKRNSLRKALKRAAESASLSCGAEGQLEKLNTVINDWFKQRLNKLEPITLHNK
jgi:hypothetical protein